KKKGSSLSQISRSAGLNSYHFLHLSNEENDDAKKPTFEPFDTQKKYKRDGKYIEKREKLHERIRGEFLKSRPTAILIGGGSGVGKSSSIGKFVLPYFSESFILIDADEIKNSLPEYEDFKNNQCHNASDYVHEESSDIVEMLIEDAIQINGNFIYDATMSKYEKYKDLIRRLKGNNYYVFIIFIDADVDIALERVGARFINADGSIGRYVSEDVVKETNSNSAKTFLRIFEDVDGYTLINNNEEPIIIASDKEISRIELFNLFIKKAL
ncbi:zeta toxin family protein, partial [Providencia sp. NPDC089923]|uniref:zeta toxin family protein n=1 Tax=Providencia sp. NPDC089923 TaxID=3415004 RepID=UPI003C2AB28A